MDIFTDEFKDSTTQCSKEDLWEYISCECGGEKLALTRANVYNIDVLTSNQYLLLYSADKSDVYSYAYGGVIGLKGVVVTDLSYRKKREYEITKLKPSTISASSVGKLSEVGNIFWNPKGEWDKSYLEPRGVSLFKPIVDEGLPLEPYQSNNIPVVNDEMLENLTTLRSATFQKLEESYVMNYAEANYLEKTIRGGGVSPPDMTGLLTGISKSGEKVVGSYRSGWEIVGIRNKDPTESRSYTNTGKVTILRDELNDLQMQRRIIINQWVTNQVEDDTYLTVTKELNSKIEEIEKEIELWKV